MATPPDDVVAIVLAAGASTRMGADKLWADLDGRPVLAHALAAFGLAPEVTRIVVVAPIERHEAIRALGSALPATCVEGGARRQDSVAAGIAAAPDAAWYLVHDGARPLVTPALIARVLAGARLAGGAVPAVPVVDTIKRVVLEDGTERVEETVDRTALRAVQTPQAFRGDLLRRAHSEVREDATDDAAMLERLGLPVAVVDGERTNLKLTTPADLMVARALLSEILDGGHQAIVGG